jgi:hypothetical protein
VHLASTTLPFLRLSAVRVAALAGILALLAWLSLDAKTPVRDPDLWWHLAVGNWIVQHNSVPETGILSRTAAARPWMAYSWGYEVLLSRAYSWFGLTGIAWFGLLVTLGVAATLYWMCYRLSGSFWIAWLVGTTGCFAYLYSLMPRPVFFSMAAFTLLLGTIVEARETGVLRKLYAVPILFVLWANVHIQFVYGLCLLALLALVTGLERILERRNLSFRLLPPTRLSFTGTVGLILGSLVACCVGPYSFRIFQVVFDYSKSQVPYTFIQELQPPDFAYFTDYFLLFLTIAGFGVLLWKRGFDLFKLTLLVIATISAFRTSRDAWFVSISAALFIANSLKRRSEFEEDKRFTLPELAATLALFAVLLAGVVRITGFNLRDLDRAISFDYPVDAANFLRRNPLPGPIYNDINWGGFLIWYMPNYPVSFDGRNDLYGDELDGIASRSREGNYHSDSILKESQLVLLQKGLPLTSVLASDPEFRAIYEDRIAVIFVRTN